MPAWIISSSILILLVLALRAVVRERISPRLRYALWLLVLARLLLPVNLGSTGLSVLNAVERAQRRVQAVVTDPVLGYVGGTVSDSAIPDGPDMTPRRYREAWEERQAQAAAEKAGTGTPVRLSDLLLAIWAAGGAAAAAALLAVNVRFYWGLKRRGLQVGKFRGLRVYAAGGLASPCLAGLIRPAVYLTPDVLCDEAARRHVLAHEYTHYRQRDYLWSALRGVCLALHWYNPLVWYAAAASRRDGELSCDAGAVALLGEEARAAYGRTLVALATRAAVPADLLRCATTMTGGKSAVKERVALLVKRPRTRLAALCLILAAAGLFSTCVFTGPARARGPEEADGAPPALDQAPEYRVGVTAAKKSFRGEDGTELACYDFTFPTLETANSDSLSRAGRLAAERVAEAFNTEMARRLDKAVTAASKYEEYAREAGAQGRTDGPAFYQTAAADVFIQGRIVNTAFLWEDYAGGAHPNYAYTAALFDLGTGRFLTAAEVADDPAAFTAGAAELLLAGAEGLGEEFDSGAWGNWRDIVRDWSATGAAYFGEDGLYVRYSPYDLGPYTLGGVELLAKYGDIAPLLGPGGREKLGLDGDTAVPECSGESRTPERTAMLEAYASILELAFSGKRSAYDYYDPGQTDPEELARNSFAVLDVDGDGRDELVINYNQTIVAGMNVTVYGYDTDTGEVRQELRDFCAAEFYSNGYVRVDASHNHGRNSLDGDWWPYSLYRYNPHTDAYRLTAMVDAWNREQMDRYYGQPFPEEADADGDGVVYYAGDSWDYEAPVDGKEYRAWTESWQAGAEKVEIPYLPLTRENVENLCA